jgi:predicted PurR-regulated permease PerM
LERDPLVRGLLLMLAAIGAVWLGGWLWQVGSQFGDVLLLFFLAWLVAFVLNPVARRLERVGVPRILGVALVYAMLAIILVTIALLLVPAVVSQLVQLAASLPVLADDLQNRADELHSALVKRGLPEAQLAEVYRNAITRAETVGTTALSSSLTIATTLVGGLLRASLVLIISFYIMLDGDKIGRLFVGLMPERYRAGVSSALEQIDRTFGGFVRGQLVQAVIYSLGTWIIMQLAALPYALVLSIFAGVAMAIPIIGPYLAMGPPLVLTVILSPGSLWWVFVLLFVLQFVVVNVLAPRIMSQQVGIHPLLVFAAVLIGAQIGGGWGAIFGVPVAAMLVLLGRLFYQRVILDMPLYRTGARLSVEAIAPVTRPVSPATEEAVQ